YSKSHIPQVIRYIQNQEEHHKKITFIDEYIKFLESFGIDYRREYIFKEPE
ncbi:MAG: transposase, partial [Chitinophagaceae bacterium]